MTDPTSEPSDVPPEYNPFVDEAALADLTHEQKNTERLGSESWLPIGLAMAILSIFAGVLVVGILIALLHHLKMLPTSVQLVLGGLAFHGAAIFGIFAALFWRVPAGQRSEALLFRRPTGKDFLLVFTMLITLMVMSFGMLQFSSLVLDAIGYEIQDDQKLEMLLKGSPDAWIAMGILAVIVAPFTEEIMFRRVLYGSLKWASELIARPYDVRRTQDQQQWLGTIVAAFAATVTSALFALIHFEPVQFLSLFCLALGLQYSLHRSKNLLVPIMIHLLFNSWTVVALSIARIFNIDMG